MQLSPYVVIQIFNFLQSQRGTKRSVNRALRTVSYVYYFDTPWLLCISRENLPRQWDKKLNQFQKMLVIKALRLDKVTNAMQDYVAGATIPAVKDVTDGVEAVRHCAAAFGVLLVRERGILALSDKANDEGTNALMSDYIREQEKTSWMLRAYLA